MSARSSGIVSLDRLLGGGLFPGDVIEIYGESATGKTQLCTYLAATVSRWNKGTATAIYFDLKNDFSPMRLLEFSGGNETGLDNVMVFRLDKFEKLLSTLDGVKTEFTGGCGYFYSTVKLIVVDSAPMAIYPEVPPNDHAAWRYLPERLLQRLEWMAHNMQLTVIVTNHAVRNWPPSFTDSIPDVKAALGKYWNNRLKIRIRLSKLSVSSSANCYSAFLEKCTRGYAGETFNFCVETNTIIGEH